MATQNNFKSTAICGIFTNSDYPDGSILANELLTVIYT